MSMLEWAKDEVAIAIKRERGDKPEGEWDYGCACYDSAMRAFESLLLLLRIQRRYGESPVLIAETKVNSISVRE